VSSGLALFLDWNFLAGKSHDLPRPLDKQEKNTIQENNTLLVPLPCMTTANHGTAAT
jgi:hypothetical protein